MTIVFLVAGLSQRGQRDERYGGNGSEDFMTDHFRVSD
jgi:hypothetical protein